MMFELRWLEDGYKVVGELRFGDRHPLTEPKWKLQYRQLRMDMRPPIWSEWKDVPMVNEQ